jgi:threonine dehydrogenase-like Zn-dependent dehydrogenase
MRAVVMRNCELVVDTFPKPQPREGEVLVKTLACGICGSDLHTVQHARRFSAQPSDGEGWLGGWFDVARDVWLGHEFCAEVVNFGPGTTAPVQPGDRVVSMPALFRDGQTLAIGCSNDIPGGFSQYMLLAAGLVLRVPDGTSTEHAALTEPLAVGVHVVAKARIQPGDACVVIGCGPVGLATIAVLRLQGVEPIIAADLSAFRRDLAVRMGAHVVVDAAKDSPFTALRQHAELQPAVIFECVGARGLLQQIIFAAPPAARVIVAGVCLEDDTIQPARAIVKELSMQFVVGYTPEEFATALALIADGRIDVDPLVSGRVGLEDVPAAFTQLAHPEGNAKVLVEPWR